MRILSMEIENFRNHKQNFITFGQVNFICGKNNSGKTTIKSALQYALTGENEWTKGGKNAKDLITYGQDEAKVLVEIKDFGTVKRTITSRGSSAVALNGYKIPDKELEKEYYDILGFGYEAISYMMDSGKFINMTPNEQKEFLFRLSSVSSAPLDSQKVINFMDNPSQEAKDTVLASLEGKAITIDTLDDLYNEFYAARRIAKKELSSLEAQLKGMGVVPAEPGIDITAVENELQEVKEKREELLKRIAVINEQIKQLNRLQEYLVKVNQRMSAIQAQMNPNINITDAEELLFGLITEIHQLEKDLEQQKTTVNVLTGQNKSLKAMLAKLKNTTKCPLSDKIVCNTDKSLVISELQNQIQKNDNAIEKARTAWNELETKMKQLKDKKEQIELQLKYASEFDNLLEQKKNLEKDIASIQIEDKTKLVNELDSCDKLYKLLNEQQLAYQEWQRRKAEADNLCQKVEEAKKRVQLYEYLVNEFSPKGVKTRILKQIIDPIQNYCNEKLSTLTNDSYSIYFEFDNGFRVKNPYGVIGLNNLSYSEKLRLGIVIQDVINSLTGTRILVVDNVEVLDDTNIKLLLELLEEIKDNYDNIFIIMTTEENDFSEFKRLAHSKVFLVEEGEVKEV